MRERVKFFEGAKEGERQCWCVGVSSSLSLSFKPKKKRELFLVSKKGFVSGGPSSKVNGSGRSRRDSGNIGRGGALRARERKRDKKREHLLRRRSVVLSPLTKKSSRFFGLKEKALLRRARLRAKAKATTAAGVDAGVEDSNQNDKEKKKKKKRARLFLTKKKNLSLEKKEKKKGGEKKKKSVCSSLSLRPPPYSSPSGVGNQLFTHLLRLSLEKKVLSFSLSLFFCCFVFFSLRKTYGVVVPSFSAKPRSKSAATFLSPQPTPRARTSRK